MAGRGVPQLLRDFLDRLVRLLQQKLGVPDFLLTYVIRKRLPRFFLKKRRNIISRVAGIGSHVGDGQMGREIAVNVIHAGDDDR